MRQRKRQGNAVLGARADADQWQRAEGFQLFQSKEARCTLLFYLGEQPPPHTGPCDTPRLAESSANRFVSGVGLPH